MKTKTSRPLSQRLRQAMAELQSAMGSDRSLEELFTVRTVDISAPAHYSARTVRMLRTKLRVSQAVFAQLIGVSVQLVEHWEQGVCQPRATACRLLDEISRDPEGFLSRHLTQTSVRFRKTG